MYEWNTAEIFYILFFVEQPYLVTFFRDHSAGSACLMKVEALPKSVITDKAHNVVTPKPVGAV